MVRTLSSPNYTRLSRAHDTHVTGTNPAAVVFARVFHVTTLARNSSSRRLG